MDNKPDPVEYATSLINDLCVEQAAKNSLWDLTAKFKHIHRGIVILEDDQERINIITQGYSDNDQITQALESAMHEDEEDSQNEKG